MGSLGKRKTIYPGVKSALFSPGQLCGLQQGIAFLDFHSL